MIDYQMQSLLLAGTICWEKHNSDVAEKCVQWLSSTLINEKEDFTIFNTQLSV
jgi:hypothetical protein